MLISLTVLLDSNKSRHWELRTRMVSYIVSKWDWFFLSVIKEIIMLHCFNGFPQLRQPTKEEYLIYLDRWCEFRTLCCT
jgi:hypothetical protein